MRKHRLEKPHTRKEISYFPLAGRGMIGAKLLKKGLPHELPPRFHTEKSIQSAFLASLKAVRSKPVAWM
jgi:hypothetical protein